MIGWGRACTKAEHAVMQQNRSLERKVIMPLERYDRVECRTQVRCKVGDHVLPPGARCSPPPPPCCAAPTTRSCSVHRRHSTNTAGASILPRPRDALPVALLIMEEPRFRSFSRPTGQFPGRPPVAIQPGWLGVRELGAGAGGGRGEGLVPDLCPPARRVVLVTDRRL